MKTYVPGADNIEKNWYVVDASGKVLGRLATEISRILMGKHKAYYVPFLDCGDYVIVINADKVELTGKKLDQKLYRRHTGYLGGLKETTARKMVEKHPDRVIISAVKGMLPKNKLGRKMLKKLKVYKGAEHKHMAQKPIELKF